MKPLCIYHGNCADGFGAAWVVRKYFGDEVEFFAGFYDKPAPDVTGRDVIMVDFSYKRDVLTEMSYKANSILVIDHHKSAASDLAYIATSIHGWDDFQNNYTHECYGRNQPVIGAVFDMEKSGAGLVWSFFFPDTPMPRLIEHIQDRDLWKFDLDGTREIQAALFSYPYDFEIWDQLAENVDQLRSDGAAIERKHFKDINEFIAAAAYRDTIAGHEVPVLNCPYFWSSDAGHIMGVGEPFAACYWDSPTGRTYSLRSAPDGLDVSEIAKQFGGGGHKHAAGFTIKREEKP
jgi:oligoribonuclease NrnB/cAMP/cGMP phosphodiesterase (DHH superfamily)